MDTRICTKCKVTKPVASFSYRNKARGTRQSWCTSCMNNHRNGRRETHGDELRATRRRRYATVKEECMAAYGGSCVCCGATELVWLTIDHVAGDGSAHRKTLPSGGRAGVIYAWLKRNSFPTGFQVLCFNCNVAKHLGGCPHAQMRTLTGAEFARLL